MACLRRVEMLGAFVLIAQFSGVLLSEISVSRFRRYNFGGVGCPSATFTPRKHQCLVLCASLPDCVAFSYNTTDGICVRCYAGNTTDISYGKPSYWLKTTSASHTETNFDAYMNGNIKLLIKAEGTIRANSPYLMFMEITVFKNGLTSLMMKMMLYSDSTVQLDALVNNTWTNSCTRTSPVTFTVGAYLDIAVLISSSLIHIYFNSLYCCNYTVLLSRDDIVGVGLYGFNFTEFSI